MQPQRRVDYSSCVMPVPRLSIADKKEMSLLHAAQFGEARQFAFARDLENRDAAILVNAAGRLISFTTVTTIEAAWKGNGICALCTGDLVHDRDENSARGIAIAWMRHAGGTRRRTQFPLYWLLSSFEEDPARPLADLVKSFYVGGSDPASELELFTNALANASLRGQPSEDGVRFILCDLEEANFKPLARRSFQGTMSLQDALAS